LMASGAKAKHAASCTQGLAVHMRARQRVRGRSSQATQRQRPMACVRLCLFSFFSFPFCLFLICLLISSLSK
jgi:hypothetical protein